MSPCHLNHKKFHTKTSVIKNNAKSYREVPSYSFCFFYFAIGILEPDMAKIIKAKNKKICNTCSLSSFSLTVNFWWKYLKIRKLKIKVDATNQMCTFLGFEYFGVLIFFWRFYVKKRYEDFAKIPKSPIL